MTTAELEHKLAILRAETAEAEQVRLKSLLRSTVDALKNKSVPAEERCDSTASYLEAVIGKNPTA